MPASPSEPTGTGNVRETFPLSGRGLALVVEDGFSGTIQPDGIVESRFGRAPYNGPEFLDSRSERKAWAVVIVDPAVEPLFMPGKTVRFYRND